MKHQNIWKLLGYYISGNRMPDEECIDTWKLEEPHHKQILDDLGNYRKMLDFDVQDEVTTKAWKALSQQMKENPEKVGDTQIRSIPIIKPFFTIYRIAASIAILTILGGALAWFSNGVKEVRMVEKINPSGLKTRIDLPDGTIVWLNANSSIKYPSNFEGLKKREVQLTGEAYFDVAHDENQPFIVNTTNFHIEVLGTIFNVKSYPEDENQIATLVEGSIKLKTIGLEKETDQEILLTPNQQVTFSKKDGSVTLDLVKAENVKSWVDGKYRFKNETFESISKTLGNEYRTKFYFTDSSLKKLYFTGAINRNDDIEKILKIFQAGIPISFEIQGDSILIKPGN